jgi:hypothetical protein
MRYAIEMGLGAMTYIPNIVKIGSCIQKLMGESNFRKRVRKVINKAK